MLTGSSAEHEKSVVVMFNLVGLISKLTEACWSPFCHSVYYPEPRHEKTRPGGFQIGSDTIQAVQPQKMA